jgi:hypothetical protein
LRGDPLLDEDGDEDEGARGAKSKSGCKKRKRKKQLELFFFPDPGSIASRPLQIKPEESRPVGNRSR